MDAQLSPPTPLINAVGQGSAAVAALLADGADVNEPTADGETPLVVACILGHTEVVTTLLAANADANQARRTPDGAT
jgi:ankyrin repeat protein